MLIAILFKIMSFITLHIYFTGIIVRLVGGSSYNEGRVEVNYNGEWGTVCRGNVAYVVCRQLGLGTYGSDYSYSYFGQGSGPIWLGDVLCTGTESTIASCGHLGVKVTRGCSHYYDLGVRCYGGQGQVFYNIYIYTYICLYDVCIHI